MKLSIAAWPRALGSSLRQSLKEASLPVVQMFAWAGASCVHDMSNLNQAEIKEFMNELFPPHPFPHWQCLVLLVKSQQGRTPVATLCVPAGLFQHTGGRCEGAQAWVCASSLCVYIQGVQSLLVWHWGFCLVGKDGGNGLIQRCYNCDWIWGEKEQIICPNCCLLSSEIIGFLNVYHEDP